MTVGTLSLWDSDADPPQEAGLVYRWNGYEERSGIRSILAYVEANGERLRQRYLAWIHDLGETRIDGDRLIDHLALDEGFSYWWMTTLVEKSVFKSPELKDVIRVLALEEIVVRDRPVRLRLVSANRTLHKTLQAFARDLGIAYEWERLGVRCRRRASIRRLFRALPVRAQGLIYLARHVWERWALRHAGRGRWFGGEQALFVCSYFDNIDANAAKKGDFRSHYWGGLPVLLEQMQYEVNWLHLFVPSAVAPAAGVAASLAERFNDAPRKKQVHTFVDVYLTWRVVLRVVGTWLRLNVVAWRLRDVGHAFRMRDSQLSLWPLMRNDWRAGLHGMAAVDNLLWLSLLDAALRDIPHQQSGLYLCENQAWERALIHLWRRHGHGRLVAVVHSTVRFWDLRYFADPRTVRSVEPRSMPQPDVSALNGEMAVKAYLEVGYPQERIVECEALRYGYLGELDGHRPARANLSGCKTILVLGDVMLPATVRLLRLLEAAVPDAPALIRFVLKPHPNCIVYTDDFPALKLRVVNEPLSTVLPECDVAYASNTTSAALDSYLFGLHVVVLLDAPELNFSPLRGQPGVCFVSTPAQLANALWTAPNSDVDRSDRIGFFFLDPALPRWSRLLAS